MKTSIKIAISLIIIGSLAAVLGNIFGPKLKLNDFNTNFSSSEVINESFENMEKINVSLNSYSVKVLLSEDGKIHVSYPNIKEEARKISIKEMDRRELTISEREKDIDIDLFFKGKNFSKEIIIIKMPKNTPGKIRLNLGSLTFSDIDIEDIFVTLDAGSFKFNNGIMVNSQVSTAMGSINLKNANPSNVTFSTAMGSIDLKNAISKNISLNTAMGSIDYSGEISGDNSFSTEMGSIDVNLNQDRNNLGLSTDTEMGSVKINGSSQKFIEDKSNFENFLELSTEMGSIKVKFK